MTYATQETLYGPIALTFLMFMSLVAVGGLGYVFILFRDTIRHEQLTSRMRPDEWRSQKAVMLLFSPLLPVLLIGVIYVFDGLWSQYTLELTPQGIAWQGFLRHSFTPYSHIIDIQTGVGKYGTVVVWSDGRKQFDMQAGNYSQHPEAFLQVLEKRTGRKALLTNHRIYPL